jgi:hypothetical protein
MGSVGEPALRLAAGLRADADDRAFNSRLHEAAHTRGTGALHGIADD